MNQVTTATFFKVEGIKNKFWAFSQMRLGMKSLKNVQGLEFYKLLGSGSKKGFSPIPDFGTYVLLAVWHSEAEANNFFKNNVFFKKYQLKSCELFTVFLTPAEAHGKWDGKQPFIPNAKLALDKPVVVLTRASIRLTKLISFWKRVGHVSSTLKNYEGLALSIGVGEWPLIQQATISIWTTQAEMLDYAYKNQKHKEVVLLTRKLKWYKEELFARFVPYKFEGVWNGKNVENMLD
jgi:hypothetical protein